MFPILPGCLFRTDDLAAHELVRQLKRPLELVDRVFGSAEARHEVVALALVSDLVREPTYAPPIDACDLAPGVRDDSQEPIDGLLDVALFEPRVDDHECFVSAHIPPPGSDRLPGPEDRRALARRSVRGCSCGQLQP